MPSLSGLFNNQQFTDGGMLASNYRLYTYAPGTTTHKVVYTDAAGLVPQTYTSDGLGGQYIALNSRGETPAPLFLSSGSYDLTLKTPAGVTVWTRRATGINDQADTTLTTIRAELASTNDATKAAGQVGYNKTLAYASGTVGEKINRRVDVNDYVTGGLGTLASPWTGWDTAITWTTKTTYIFRDGYYSYATSPNFGAFRLCLIGTGSTVIQHTGTGYAMVFDGGAYPSDGFYRCEVRGIQLESNSGATGGLDLRHIHHSTFEMAFRNIPGKRVRIRSGVLNRFHFSGAGGLVEGQTVTSTTGISLEPRDAGEKCTFSTFYDTRMYGISGWAVDMASGGADNCLFLNGALESNTNGMRIATGCLGNVVIGMDFEGNTTTDIDVTGAFTAFENCNSTGAAYVRSGAVSTRFEGGVFNAITLDSGSVGTTLAKVNYGQNSGVLTNNGTDTSYEKVRNATSGNLIDTPPPTIASASTITIPYGVTAALITGNTAITAVNMPDGQRTTLVFASNPVVGGANLLVAGGATWTASNNDTLTLVKVGSNVYEAGRAVI